MRLLGVFGMVLVIFGAFGVVGAQPAAAQPIEIEELCVNRYNGDVRYSAAGQCSGSEFQVIVDDAAPFDLCVNRYNLDERYPHAGDGLYCSGSEISVTIQGDGSVDQCINRYNGDLRYPRAPGACSGNELAAVI